MELPIRIGKGKSIRPNPESPREALASETKNATLCAMKFVLAILTFLVFAFFISWGVILMMHGSPWLLLASVGVFLGTFIKFGCLSH